MKYYKFEKLQGGSDPIIRITYKNWWGKLITKDVCKSYIYGDWEFMESGRLIYECKPINNFYNNDYKFYWVNGL